MRSTTQRPYYGWYLAVTLALTETISWGIVFYTFTVFLTPMEAELGWSRAELTAGFSLMLLVAGVTAYPVGAWIDRHGARWMMTLGSIGASIFVIAWSLVSTQSAYYIVWIGLGVCSAAILYDPAFAVIAHWFHARRGTALAVVTFAAGFASTIFLPLADLLLRSFGWRTAVLILGLFLACVTVPLHAIMLRRRPSDLGLNPDGASHPPARSSAGGAVSTFGQAMRGRAFWMIALAFALISISASAIRIHFIPYLIEHDIDASSAAAATGIIGAMQVVGRVLFAPLDRRYSIQAVMIGVFALQTVSFVFLVLGSAHLLIGAFIVVFGAAQGAATLARPSILVELYGAENYGRISSILTFILTVTSTVAPLGASLIYDQFLDYQPVLWVVMLLALAGTGVAVIFHRRTGATMTAQPVSARPD